MELNPNLMAEASLRFVSRQHDHLREEGSSTPSSSDAETVGVPYPEVQLDFSMSHVAHGKPVPAPCSPQTNDSGVEAKTAVSNAGSGHVTSAKQATPSRLEVPAGTSCAPSLHPSKTSGLSSKCSSHKSPAVSETSVQGVPTGTMRDEVRPGPRRVFMGSAGVLDVPKKVPTQGVQQVVAPISSRPVFTGPGSIPPRTECFPKQATAYPCAGEADALVLESVCGTSEALLPGGRPLPPRPPTPKRKRLEPEDVSRSSDSATSGEGVTLTPENAEAFLARLDARPTCPSGHPLLSFGSPEPNWWCSVCKREFATRRLLWGCRVCDFDICGNCLANQRSGPAISPAPGQEANQGPAPSEAKAWPSIKLLRESGFLTGKDMFPDDLRLALDVDGRNLSVLGSSRAPELKGGFRKVYHLKGEEPAANLVLKLAGCDADNVNEVRSATACPAAFARIFDSGSIWVSLGEKGLCQAHYVVAERAIPLTALLEGPALPPAACTSLALQCCRVVLQATLAGIKCRDLGQKQWGLRVPPGFNLHDEVSLQQVRNSLVGEGFTLIILDANCCIPVPQAILLGPRKMASYWALLTRLVGPSASERLQMFLRAHNFNARSCLSALTRDHVTGPCS